ncbi:hypothetical protein [Mycolicibacterium sp.]|uniref:hypothetical protein n=1 Tax=Mycolicibacterium sp. TaxID=2320850 RepID=UPI0037CACB58
MNRVRRATILLLCLAAAGCTRTSGDVAVTASTTTTSPVETTVTATVTSTAERIPTTNPPPGIAETTRTELPPDAVTCAPTAAPAASITTQVADPQAPRVTVAIPDGWTPGPASGDVGARLSGPNGMFATVTVSRTDLDPAAAFTEYADRIVARAAVSSVSILPAELCDYSGQKLMGGWSNTPQDAVEYRDRLAHIWTDGPAYLVAVHVQAPGRTAEFDAAAAPLIADFGVRIP